MTKQTKSIPPKPRLGRGLSSLIPSSPDTQPPASDYQATPDGPVVVGRPDAPGPRPQSQTAPGQLPIPIDQIAPNPLQPRRQFPTAELEQLTDSVARQGVLQPLLVRPATDPAATKPYVLIAGERRLRAATKAGLQSVPCIVRSANRRQMLEWSLVENIHRQDLNPVERGRAYQEYADRFKLTQLEVARRLGQPRSTVANYLRLLDLPQPVQDLLADGSLSFGHAKLLAGLVNDPSQQVSLAKRAASGGLSVRQLEAAVAQLTSKHDRTGPVTVATPSRSAYLADLEGQLSHALGMPVSIAPGRAKHSGRITIRYGSLEDFDRIIGALGLKVQS